MRQILLDEFAAPGTSLEIATNKNGYLPGMRVVADIFQTGTDAFEGSVQWEVSEDGDTWEVVGTPHVVGPFGTQTIKLKKLLRVNCTALAAGTVRPRLLVGLD